MNGPVVFINPGTGPVLNADEGNAWVNMGTFVADLRERGIPVKGITRQAKRDDGDGRYEFDLEIEDHVRALRIVTVSMPGLSIEWVRYLNKPDQDIWHFPRLYIDGSSWVWEFALGVCGPHESEQRDQ